VNVFAIVNPTAGNGRAGRLSRRLKDLFAAHGIRCHIRITEAPGHGTELAAEAARDQWDGIVAIGGDGTVQEAVNGLLDSSIPLGIIPVGTGNDFARNLGIPRNPHQAAAVIGARHVRRVDLGEVNGRRYVQVAGVGFDAQVAAMVSANRSRLPGGGALPYLWGALHQLMTFRNRELTITLKPDDGRDEVQRVPALMVAVGNSRFYAGGLKICPEARVDDGLLDVCIIGDLTRWQRVEVLARVFSGSHVRHPKVHYARASALHIDGPRDLLVQADGQIIGHLPATLRALSRAITVFAPRPGLDGSAAAQL